MRIGPAAIAVLLFAASAASACEVGEFRYFACTFSDGRKAVEICHDDRHARYTFGPSGGAPDLQMSRPLAEVDLTPWPGIGRTIWEEVTFRNQGHSYTVYGSIDRAPAGDGSDEIAVAVAGGIVVRRGAEEIASLTCDPGSVHFLWGTDLFDAKNAAGQCYDSAAREWRPCRPQTDGE